MNPKYKADILIYNGTILPGPRGRAPIPNGMIAVSGGLIAAIGSKAEMKDWFAAEVRDAAGGLILPGLVNTHTHLPMTLFRGLADDLPLDEWLNEHIFPAEKAHITPESVRLGARLAAAEMLLSGTTTCCDGYFHEDAAAQTLQEIGIRAVLAQGVIDHPAPGVPDPARNVATAIEFVEKWQGRHPNLIPSIFCHSPYACSAQTLIRAKKAARDLNVLFQIHVAETKNEAEKIHADRRHSPVGYLDHLDLLDHRTLLVHAVWVDAADIQTIAARGAAVAHAPESNMKLGSGIAPVPGLLAAGIRVGLGTDGCASNNDLDLFGEMDTAAKLHKVAGLDPAQMDAGTLLSMATISGAEAIGLAEKIGSLEPGKQADILIVDTRKPHLTPMYNPISQVVYAMRGSDARDVMVAGKWLVKNRELLTIDLSDLFSELEGWVPEIAQSDKKQWKR